MSKSKLDEAKKHFAAGRIDRARAIVERLLEGKGDRRDVHRLAAALDLAEERFESALGHLDSSPADAWVEFARARSLLGLGRYDEAEIAMRRSRDLDPSDPGIYELETMLRRAKDDLPAALHAIEGAIALHPTRVSALAMKADVLLALGRDDEALETFRSAVRTRSSEPREHAKLLRRFAEILEARGEKEEAEAARGIASTLDR